MLANSFAAVDPTITLDTALIRAHLVEARKNLLRPSNSVKPVPRVASFAPSVASSFPPLGLPSTAALQVPSKLPDENAKALAEMKDAL